MYTYADWDGCCPLLPSMVVVAEKKAAVRKAGGILATAGVEQLLDFLIEITFNQEESDNQDNQDNP